jgi:hypothetical protein
MRPEDKEDGAGVRNNEGAGGGQSRGATTTATTRPAGNPLIRGFGPCKEYSVIHTDRSLNLMSDPFVHVMRDLNHNCSKPHTMPTRSLLYQEGKLIKR